HQAFVILGCESDVLDNGVCRRAGIDFSIGATDHSLVRPDISERLTSEGGFDRRDLDPSYACLPRRHPNGSHQQKNTRHRGHARQLPHPLLPSKVDRSTSAMSRITPFLDVGPDSFTFEFSSTLTADP